MANIIHFKKRSGSSSVEYYGDNRMEEFTELEITDIIDEIWNI